ncbi:MAG: ATP-binding protein [Humidesulfovibrio sp.]|nr:ATP-binding protein [Humidesulfovibrio sp.]
MPTEHAPAERAPHDIVLAQYQTFIGTHCRAFFDTLPTMIMALNSFRQVVFANKAAIDFLGRSNVEQVLGERPGEVLGCVNAQAGGGGCGTSRHCRNCGTVKAILAAIDGAMANGECKLLRREESVVEGLDLHVNATPLYFDDQQYIIFAITDISHETRRRSMEHIFFHDVLNLAGGINGLVEVLRLNNTCGNAHELAVLQTASQSLVDEIIAQRELLAAESNELTPNLAPVAARDILLQLKGLYENASVAQGQEIRIAAACTAITVVTDSRLVLRVLGNILKNALEAGKPGDAVDLVCSEELDGVRFKVHNHAFIPPNVQENIFHRRFSTKGEARGLGTYSMLLLSERYLDGNVGYTSTEAAGTTFFLRLPKRQKTA